MMMMMKSATKKSKLRILSSFVSLSQSVSLLLLYQSSVIVGYVQSDDCRCISYIRFLFVYSFLFFILVFISLLVVSKTSNARIIVHFIRIYRYGEIGYLNEKEIVYLMGRAQENMLNILVIASIYFQECLRWRSIWSVYKTQNSKPCQCSWYWPIRIE